MLRMVHAAALTATARAWPKLGSSRALFGFGVFSNIGWLPPGECLATGRGVIHAPPCSSLVNMYRKYTGVRDNGVIMARGCECPCSGTTPCDGLCLAVPGRVCH